MEKCIDIEEAKKLLSYHSCRNDDIDNIKWKKGFLGSLRPFGGTLIEENFIEVMECLKVLQKEFSVEAVDREMLADIVGIATMGRAWASPHGMLGGNHLLTKKQTQLLFAWIDIMEECLMYLLDGAVEEAFFSYEEYLDGRYFDLW